MLNNAAAAKLKPKTPTQTTERGNPCKLTCLSKAGVIRDEKTRPQNKKVPVTRFVSLTQVLIPHEAALSAGPAAETQQGPWVEN